jgi:hypothetical protein
VVEASPATAQPAPSVGFASRAGNAFELTKLFLVATDAVSENFDGGAKVINFSREPGEGAGISACGAILINDGA